MNLLFQWARSSSRANVVSKLILKSWKYKGDKFSKEKMLNLKADSRKVTAWTSSFAFLDVEILPFIYTSPSHWTIFSISHFDSQCKYKSTDPINTKVLSISKATYPAAKYWYHVYGIALKQVTSVLKEFRFCYKTKRTFEFHHEEIFPS